jgi:hypothetical protein
MDHGWLRTAEHWLHTIFGGAPAKALPYRARLFPTAPGLTVSRFVDPGSTPGNVGICLSGGGSRALTGGMGQLRALNTLKTADGRSLLGQARALSTVSGGSWAGVPFEFLTAGTSDEDYLNGYVADPGRLVPTATPGATVAETLDALPPGNIAMPVSKEDFAPEFLAIQVLLLHQVAEVPIPFLWQTLIGIHVLRPYGLYTPQEHLMPNSLFSYDAATLERDVTGPNPSLAQETAHLFAQGPERCHRPFLICNLSMFLRETGSDFELMAPVQGTPIFTGIVGTPEGTDPNGVAAGGGGVASFAFNSALDAVDGEQATAAQTRQLALYDIVGTSSAFFAEVLENLFAIWRADVDQLIEKIDQDLEKILGWIEDVFPKELRAKLPAFLDRAAMNALRADPLARGLLQRELVTWLDEVRVLTPEYGYWPVRDAVAAPAIKPTRFADGGDLENSGVASLLAYDDIDNVISFLNSDAPITLAAKGVIDADGNEIPDTRIAVDQALPLLFGYQPYDPERGYVLYAGAVLGPGTASFQHNQVFPAKDFAAVLRGLWAAIGNEGPPVPEGSGLGSADLRPAIFKQRLEVLPNPWFGVRGQRSVNVLWCYTNRVRAFYDATSPAVQAILGPFDQPGSEDSFPHYSTVRTHLSATEINLLANLTAWSVANAEDQGVFFGMFQEG